MISKGLIISTAEKHLITSTALRVSIWIVFITTSLYCRLNGFSEQDHERDILKVIWSLLCLARTSFDFVFGVFIDRVLYPSYIVTITGAILGALGEQSKVKIDA